MLNPVQFSYHMDKAQPPHHVVEAHKGDEFVGSMSWHAEKEVPEPMTRKPLKGTISDIGVEQEHRRQGIATGMWKFAHSLDVEPKPMHSPSRTSLSGGGGDAWAKSVGGRRPISPQAARLMLGGLSKEQFE